MGRRARDWWVSLECFHHGMKGTKWRGHGHRSQVVFTCWLCTYRQLIFKNSKMTLGHCQPKMWSIRTKLTNCSKAGIVLGPSWPTLLRLPGRKRACCLAENPFCLALCVNCDAEFWSSGRYQRTTSRVQKKGHRNITETLWKREDGDRRRWKGNWKRSG